MRIPATTVTHAVMLRCDLCGEIRFLQAQITKTPTDGYPRDGKVDFDVEVEIDPRDYDIADRFGKIHAEPKALVCVAGT